MIKKTDINNIAITFGAGFEGEESGLLFGVAMIALYVYKLVLWGIYSLHVCYILIFQG